MKKKKRIKKLIHIKDKVFKICLNVFIGYNLDELNKELKKFGFNGFGKEDKDNLGSSFTLYKDDNSTPYYSIWLPIDRWTLITQSVLAHELIHFLLSVTNNKGIKVINKPKYDNETLAYLYEFFFYEASCKLNDLFKNK